MNQRAKILWIVFAGIICGLMVGVGGYILLKNNDNPQRATVLSRERSIIAPTATIDTDKHYRNEEYGFELRYPSTLILEEDDKGQGVVVFFVSLGQYQEEDGQSIFVPDILIGISPDISTVSPVVPDYVTQAVKEGTDETIEIHSGIPVSLRFDARMADFTTNGLTFSIVILGNENTSTYSARDIVGRMSFFERKKDLRIEQNEQRIKSERLMHSKDLKRASAMAHFRVALFLYFRDKGVYPKTLQELSPAYYTDSFIDLSGETYYYSVHGKGDTYAL